MKHFTYQLLAMLFFMAMITTNVTAKRMPLPKMYMFGFAASFNDSTVYFTDIQEVDSAWIETKTNFLLGREYYSNQLRNYLKFRQQPNRTCIVMFDKKKSKLEKKYLKLKRLYTTSKDGMNHFDVQHLSHQDFSFKAVNMNIEEVAEEVETPKNKGNEEKAKKGK